LESESSKKVRNRTQEDIQDVEKVQEKALRQVNGLSGNTYQERCAEVGLETLEKRRERQDMAWMLKILRGKDKLDPDILFEKAGNRPQTRQMPTYGTWCTDRLEQM
jgi:hypothetical protein